MSLKTKGKRRFKFEEEEVVDTKRHHAIGEKHFINGTECMTRYVNAGCAWVSPTTDDADEPLVARHIAYAMIDENSAVKVL